MELGKTEALGEKLTPHISTWIVLKLNPGLCHEKPGTNHPGYCMVLLMKL